MWQLGLSIYKVWKLTGDINAMPDQAAPNILGAQAFEVVEWCVLSGPKLVHFGFPDWAHVVGVQNGYNAVQVTHG
jgi:hypothetical protein